MSPGLASQAHPFTLELLLDLPFASRANALKGFATSVGGEVFAMSPRVMHFGFRGRMILQSELKQSSILAFAP